MTISFFLAPSASIDSGISENIKQSSKLTMTKVIENSNCRTELAVTANMEQGKKNSTDLWKKNGCFGSQACDFSIEKANLSENTIFYINQGYLSYKDNKKMYYNDTHHRPNYPLAESTRRHF